MVTETDAFVQNVLDLNWDDTSSNEFTNSSSRSVFELPKLKKK